MNRYITRGIDNNLPITLQHQLWQLVAQRKNEQSKESHKLNKWIHIAQITVTVITEVITMMKDIEKEK
ncbi:DUF960 family protein [Staphylococcus saprophyticus]|uniref:DUF960 family protein n=1 Tax=Staphylococcus saprophyticus TaxID=29385 RepID=UPI003F69150D